MKTVISTFLIIAMTISLSYAQNDSLLVSTSSTFFTPGSSSTLGQILMSSNPNNRTLQILPQRTVDGHALNGYVFDVAYTNSAAANGFLFRTGSSNRLIINESGNVGIGTASPGYLLDIKAASTNQDLLRLSHPTYPTDAGLIIGFGQNSSSADNVAVKFKVEYGSTDYDVFDINRENRDFYYIGDGNVGIGTNSPSTKFEIVADSTTGVDIAHFSNSNEVSKAKFTLNNSGAGELQLFDPVNNSDVLISAQGDTYLNTSHGNVGIGTDTPSTKLDVVGGDVYIGSEASTNATRRELRIHGYDNNALFYGSMHSNYDDLRRTFDISTNTDTQQLKIDASANADGRITLMPGTNVGVGIGTLTMGSHKLAVEGSIGAREVVVEATSWPDYVFNPEYELLSLEQIEAHIKAKGHLPEVPSAIEVEEEGQHLGEMQQLLLKKIEEMTLHLIELKKENEALKQRVEILETTNDEN